jgi:hypothetical protein
VRQQRAFLRERGWVDAHFAAACGDDTGPALTSNAAQVAGLGRIYFEHQFPVSSFQFPVSSFQFSVFCFLFPVEFSVVSSANDCVCYFAICSPIMKRADKHFFNSSRFSEQILFIHNWFAATMRFTF